MQMLNRYFTPFALILIASAVYFRLDEFRASGLHAPLIAVAILAADVLLNWWIARNQYRWIGWAARLRQLQVWMNLVWAIPLFYLLYPFWAPMWLLFVTAPTAAALTTSRRETLACSLAAAGAMIGIYWLRQNYALEGEFLGMALSQASFIVIFALFVNGLAQTALRLRDASLR
ncbi:MAG: hypothetical protein KGM24_13320 [Elusimicrobia bacterium]|nr:hypothetical protein [Elusimicrobiota bacterium]